MTWLIILSLHATYTPTIETRFFPTQEVCEQYGRLKILKDERYSFRCVDITKEKR